MHRLCSLHECDNFEMGMDGRAHSVRTEVDHPHCGEEVAEKCPVGAIKVTKLESCFHATRQGNLDSRSFLLLLKTHAMIKVYVLHFPEVDHND